MSGHVRAITGPYGEARLAPKPDPKTTRPDWAATIGSWVVHAPGHSPAWCHFTISMIHLRDIPGVRPANKQYPKAEYELIVAALDPNHPIDFDNLNATGFCWLRPFNVVQQFHGVSDEQAVKILETLIEDAVKGQALLEPEGVRGGHRLWITRLRSLGAEVVT
jgi:hypothetical protein